jgi:hypothetical protein
MPEDGRGDQQHTCRVTLPSGLWAGDVRQREVALRAVTAEDEAFLLEQGERALPARLVTDLLARCLDGPDPRALTVGDREALLLHLRRLTLGDDLACTLICPAPGCGQRMALELRANDLLLSPYADARPSYETSLSSEGVTYQVRFRLPTGEDQEAAAELARRDTARAAGLLLERCVQHVLADGRERAPDGLSVAVVDAISAAIAERDPQAELELSVTCPECATTLTVLFDTTSFFLRELDHRAVRLLREVHTLALHYHWSERDILCLSPRRRAGYLALLAESLSPQVP